MNPGEISRGLPETIISRAIGGTVAFGDPVCPGANPDKQMKKFDGAAGTKQVQTLTLNASLVGVGAGVWTLTAAAALVTDNVVAITVNNRKMASQTFATDSDTTMALVAAEIARHEAVASAVVTNDGTNDREIVVTARNAGETLTISATVTGGAGQTTFTWAVQTGPGTNNVINGKVDGVAIEPITFGTSNNATVAALITELLEQENILSAVASDVGAVGYHNTITITTKTPGKKLTLASFAVTGGASQPTIAVAQTVAPVLPARVFGVAVQDPTKGFTRDGNGNPSVVRNYVDKDVGAIVTKGTVWVTVAVAVTAGETAAVIKVVGTEDPAVGAWVAEDYVNGAGGEIQVLNGVDTLVRGRYLSSALAAAQAELELF